MALICNVEQARESAFGIQADAQGYCAGECRQGHLKTTMRETAPEGDDKNVLTTLCHLAYFLLWLMAGYFKLIIFVKFHMTDQLWLLLVIT